MKRPDVITLLIVALALVCVGIGAVVFFVVNGGLPTNNPFDRRNISSAVEESKTLKVDATKPLTLKVLDDAGAVTVTGGDVETVQVKAIKTAYDSSQARADAEVKNIKYTIEQTGNIVTIKYELPEYININHSLNTVDFVITVPQEVIVNIKNSSGTGLVQQTVQIVVSHDPSLLVMRQALQYRNPGVICKEMNYRFFASAKLHSSSIYELSWTNSIAKTPLSVPL